MVRLFAPRLPNYELIFHFNITAIAGELSLDIYVVSLSAKGLVGRILLSAVTDPFV